MTNPERDDQSQKGWPTPKGMINPKRKGWSIPKGMTNLKGMINPKRDDRWSILKRMTNPWKGWPTPKGMINPKWDDWPLKGMINPKMDDQAQKGWQPSKGMTNPWKGRSTPKGKTTLKRDDQPLKWKINFWKGGSTHGPTDHVIPDLDNPSPRVSMGLTLGPLTHSCIVHKNYLHITAKGPIMQSDFLYMERWSHIS